eukprot:2092185-Alexandrium_andersonii.AAC.1
MKRMRSEQAALGSSSAGKSTGALAQSLTAGEASSAAAMNPTRGQALGGLLADRPSPAKGEEQPDDAEPAGPAKPGEDAGTGKVTRNTKRLEQRRRKKAADRENAAAEAAAGAEPSNLETPEASATARSVKPDQPSPEPVKYEQERGANRSGISCAT